MLPSSSQELRQTDGQTYGRTDGRTVVVLRASMKNGHRKEQSSRGNEFSRCGVLLADFACWTMLMMIVKFCFFFVSYFLDRYISQSTIALPLPVHAYSRYLGWWISIFPLTWGDSTSMDDTVRQTWTAAGWFVGSVRLRNFYLEKCVYFGLWPTTLTHLQWIRWPMRFEVPLSKSMLNFSAHSINNAIFIYGTLEYRGGGGTIFQIKGCTFQTFSIIHSSDRVADNRSIPHLTSFVRWQNFAQFECVITLQSISADVYDRNEKRRYSHILPILLSQVHVVKKKAVLCHYH